jgi:para-aminobenzoate synthetase / 4-amino-4-deoxychorismate lyase
MLTRCRIDHTAVGPEGSIELRRPVGELTSDETSEVAMVLSEAEAAARRGCYVAGFVAYEAAPAFDAAFRTQPSCSRDHANAVLPLAWFGLFAEAVPAPVLPPVSSAPSRTGATGQPCWVPEVDASTHSAAVATIRDSIAKGEAYLVNYTTRFRRPWATDDDAFSLYCRLLASYRSGFHAFFETDQWAVACGSPELFFEQSGACLLTRPMKGTAPRGRWSLEDRGRAEALRASAKERAENAMVVDLLRNDLGRIAVPGTVAVPSLWRVEQHPSLWQLTSTVTATTREGVGLPDVFGALFPSASVTGAPKVSAMSVIADVEASPRGVYCGAVGFLAPGRGPISLRTDRTARFAVAIRTAVVDKGRRLVEYGSGGGITWDSQAEQEWEEVVLKAEALMGPLPPALVAGEGLMETMAFEPGAGDGSVRDLGDHLARLADSARYFGLVVPPGTHELVAKAVRGLGAPARVRLVLRASGPVEVETLAFADEVPTSTLRLCVDLEPVSSSDVMLFHKTTNRRRYDERTRRHPAADDVVLVNERGEVTETTRANLAVLLDDQWYTPPINCGLLPGVERARRLADGRLVERVVSLDDLRDARAVATLSSLRGWRPAHVLARCLC